MWICKKCNEQVEDNFAVCWNCGTSCEGVEDPSFRKADDIVPPGARAGLPRSGRRSFPWLVALVLFNMAIAVVALLANDKRVFLEDEVRREELSTANGKQDAYELLAPPTRYYRWGLAAVAGVNMAAGVSLLVGRGPAPRPGHFSDRR